MSHAAPQYFCFQVSDNETMQVNVTLIQHSCLDGVVNIRDGGEGGDDVDRLISDAKPSTRPGGELINRIGFFNSTTIAPSGGVGVGGAYSFNSTRPVVTFELTSRNRSCRVNMQLRVVAVPAKSEYINNSMYTARRLS